MASSEESASSASSPSVDSYIGSVISLTSKGEIRYEGVLVNINPAESTIALQDVKCYGSEGRKRDGPYIPSSDKVYGYIVFRGTDIKDLQVKSSSPVPSKPETHNDPAIIQSHYAYAPTTHTPSASVVDGSLTGLSSKPPHQDLARQQFPDTFSKYQTGSHQSSWAFSPALANVDGSMHSQGYGGTSSGQAHGQQQFVSFQPQTVSLHNPLHYPEGYAPIGVSNFPATATSLAFPSQSTISNPSNSSSLLSSNASLASSLPSHLPVMSSLASSNQELNPMMSSIPGPSQTSFLPVSSIMPFSSSSVLGSTSEPIPLLTPDKLTKSVPAASSSLDKLYPEPKDKGPLFPSSINSLSAVSGMPQEPWLPLPAPSQQVEPGAMPFNQEFDFTAMNEKFNKDEVWGSLGKEKQRATIGDRREEGLIHYTVEDNESYAQDPPKHGSKPVYNKDDFFDTLSCNSLNRGGWSGRARLSERMRLDTETFGEFQQRPPMGHGNYGTPHSGYYRGAYNRGRGYGYYGGRGRGGYRPF